jgi:hypothetical protein
VCPSSISVRPTSKPDRFSPALQFTAARLPARTHAAISAAIASIAPGSGIHGTSSIRKKRYACPSMCSARPATQVDDLLEAELEELDRIERLAGLVEPVHDPVDRVERVAELVVDHVPTTCGRTSPIEPRSTAAARSS